MLDCPALVVGHPYRTQKPRGEKVNLLYGFLQLVFHAILCAFWMAFAMVCTVTAGWACAWVKDAFKKLLTTKNKKG